MARQFWGRSNGSSADCLSAGLPLCPAFFHTPPARLRSDCHLPKMDHLPEVDHIPQMVTILRLAIWLSHSSLIGTWPLHDCHMSVLCCGSLEVSVNKQRLALGEDGWAMCGFVGPASELKKRLLYGGETRAVLQGRAPQVGLVAKLLKDSGQASLIRKVLAAGMGPRDRQPSLLS